MNADGSFFMGDDNAIRESLRHGQEESLVAMEGRGTAIVLNTDKDVWKVDWSQPIPDINMRRLMELQVARDVTYFAANVGLDICKPWVIIEQKAKGGSLRFIYQRDVDAGEPGRSNWLAYLFKSIPSFESAKYRLKYVAGTEHNSDQAALAAYKQAQENHQQQQIDALADASLNFVVYMVPGYAAARSFYEGDYVEGAISLLGDATLAIGWLARFVKGGRYVWGARVAGAAIEGGIGIYRSKQAFDTLVNDGDIVGATGQAGEAAMRLLGAVLLWKGRGARAPLSNAQNGHATLRVSEGNLTAPAKFVREVNSGETVTDLIMEGKARTWVNEAEHAILSLAGEGRTKRVVVSGGRDGIDFIKKKKKSFFEMNGELVQVRRVIGHTHPRATGPSQGDLNVLDILGQSRSYIVEIGGEPSGTLIRPK